MNKEEKAKLWSERIQEFQSSGQTCKQYGPVGVAPPVGTPCRENKETKFILKVL